MSNILHIGSHLLTFFYHVIFFFLQSGPLFFPYLFCIFFGSHSIFPAPVTIICHSCQTEHYCHHNIPISTIRYNRLVKVILTCLFKSCIPYALQSALIIFLLKFTKNGSLNICLMFQAANKRYHPGSIHPSQTILICTENNHYRSKDNEPFSCDF